jgi:hypothetical protein
MVSKLILPSCTRWLSFLEKAKLIPTSGLCFSHTLTCLSPYPSGFILNATCLELREIFPDILNKSHSLAIFTFLWLHCSLDKFHALANCLAGNPPQDTGLVLFTTRHLPGTCQALDKYLVFIHLSFRIKKCSIGKDPWK